MQQKVISSFREEFAFLSNFYESVIYVDGDRYQTVEHAYQAMKTFDPWMKRKIREASTPAEAKKLGKSVKLRPDWDNVKVNIMKMLIQKKFENPFLRPLLVNLKDAKLIEGNTWGDTFWGVCKDHGENWLGKILMSERDSIISESIE